MGPLDVWLNITDLFSSLHCLHFIFSPGLLFTSLSLCKLICYPSQILILAKPLSHCFHLCFSVLCFPLLSLLHTLHTGGWPCPMGAVAPIGRELRDKRFYLQKWLWSSYVAPSCPHHFSGDVTKCLLNLTHWNYCEVHVGAFKYYYKCGGLWYFRGLQKDSKVIHFVVVIVRLPPLKSHELELLSIWRRVFCAFQQGERKEIGAEGRCLWWLELWEAPNFYF